MPTRGMPVWSHVLSDARETYGVIAFSKAFTKCTANRAPNGFVARDIHFKYLSEDNVFTKSFQTAKTRGFCYKQMFNIKL